MRSRGVEKCTNINHDRCAVARSDRDNEHALGLSLILGDVYAQTFWNKKELPCPMLERGEGDAETCVKRNSSS